VVPVGDAGGHQQLVVPAGHQRTIRAVGEVGVGLQAIRQGDEPVGDLFRAPRRQAGGAALQQAARRNGRGAAHGYGADDAAERRRVIGLWW
jgi:hypothetical protein